MHAVVNVISYCLIISTCLELKSIFLLDQGSKYYKLGVVFEAFDDAKTMAVELNESVGKWANAVGITIWHC